MDFIAFEAYSEWSMLQTGSKTENGWDETDKQAKADLPGKYIHDTCFSKVKLIF